LLKLINVSLVKETSLVIFCEAFRWYNEIYSRKIELSEKNICSIFERVHAKALQVYDRKMWSSLKTDGDKFWYSENPDKKIAFPLIAVLANYGNAIFKDRFLEIAYLDEPDKATIEFFVFFIYIYVKTMKITGNVTTLLSPELIPPAIDPIVEHLVVPEKQHLNFDSLNINLIIDILRLNNMLYQANNLEGLYNQLALNKVWKIKSDDTIIGVILLDGDKFKLVNDNCGHNVGDEVLEIYRDSILNVIKSFVGLKPRAFPARWGGEEFCICVFDSNEKEIIGLSKKIKSELKLHVKWKELKERGYEGQKEKVDFPRTFSQGVALGKKSDFAYLNALVKVADEQMYKAKNEGGRNCIYYNGNKVLDDDM